MKVWGMTDPRDLNRKHLLGEHLENHILLSGGWTHHPESLENRFGGQDEFARFRHELLRIEMNRRYPGRHSLESHPTPVKPLKGKLKKALEAYERGEVTRSGFPKWVRALGFPKTPLGYDTPWARDGIKRAEYLEIGNLWDKHQHKVGYKKS